MHTYHSIHRSLRVGLFGALLSSQAWSGQPLITDDTGTLGAGGNQIELTYGHQRDAVDGFSGETITRSLPLTYTRGVTNTLDLYVGAAHQRIAVDDGAGTTATEVGWGNVAFGGKWRFYENTESKFSMGVKPEIQLPVSEAVEARGLGIGRASYGITMIATQETDFGAVHFNLASNRVNYALSANQNAVRRDQYRVSVAPVWQASEKLKLALDLGARTRPDVTGDPWTRYIEGGLVYASNADLDLALGVIHNFSGGNVNSTQLLMGLTWRY
jgi:hypothetical protein